jgi:hypothetical protein
MTTKRPPKPAFESEPPTLRGKERTETVAREAELKHRAAAAKAAQRTVPRGIIPVLAISPVDAAWTDMDDEARAFLAEVDGVRSGATISTALGMEPAAGFALLERLLFEGLVSLRQ